MNLPKSLTTVTTLSKVLAAILFITLPFLGFYLGMEYQKRSKVLNSSFPSSLYSDKFKLLSCDELVRVLSNEYENWNLSCETDSDCWESEVKQCGCQSVNTNSQKAKDIDEIISLKNCSRPLLQCQPFKCSCENKVCKRASINNELLSTPALIEQANNNGKITKDQRILYLAYAVYEYASLLVEYKSNVGWRGTSIVEEIKETAFSPKMCELDIMTQGELRRLLGGGKNCAEGIDQPIDPVDQECLVDTDCMWGTLDCTSCSCGISLNIKYKDKYNLLNREKCKDYHGAVCDFYCDLDVRCINQRCVP